MIFLICLSVSHAGKQSTVESYGGYIILNGELAINKKNIFKVKQDGSDVCIYITYKGRYYQSECVKDINIAEVLKAIEHN